MDQGQTPIELNAQNATPQKSITFPIILMIAPAALLFLVLLISIVLGLLLPDMPATDGSLFSQPSPLKSVINIILFIVGAGTVVLGPISFIVGLVLLIQRKSKK